MFALKLTALNKSLGQRIIILLVVLTLLNKIIWLWLSIDSQLILKRVNYETTVQERDFVLCVCRQMACEMFIV